METQTQEIVQSPYRNRAELALLMVSLNAGQDLRYSLTRTLEALEKDKRASPTALASCRDAMKRFEELEAQYLAHRTHSTN